MSSDTPLRFFEDIEPGETARAGPMILTRESIFAFARAYDPQPFHLDEAAAAASPLGGLAASGWHTSAVGMRLYYDGFVRHVASMGAPGIEEARWIRPVRPDDPLSLDIAILDKRESASRPDRGFIGVSLDLRNGAGETVMTERFPMMVQRRGTTIASAVPPAIETPAACHPAPDPLLAAFYDDVPVGHVVQLGTQVFTAESIIDFATAYDPQYFHVDAERARQSPFGSLAASGWQTAAFWMKHFIAAKQRAAAARAASGQACAPSGPSPGYTDLKWIRPVYAGQTIGFSLKVTGKRPIATRGGWGLVLTENAGHSADGTKVFSFDGRLMWPLAPH